MGGEMGVRSTLDKGSTFWFTLQLARHKASVTSANGAVPVLKDVNSVHAAPVPCVSNSIRIIFAEDNPVNQLVGSKQLKKLGYNNVQVVGNGIDAVAAWQQNDGAVILMDCQMPEMDGYDATRKIRQLEMERKLSHTRIIAMTANAMQGDRQRCLAAGMDDYIPKPVDTADLKNALAKAVSETERRDRVNLQDILLPIAVYETTIPDQISQTDSAPVT